MSQMCSKERFRLTHVEALKLQFEVFRLIFFSCFDSGFLTQRDFLFFLCFSAQLGNLTFFEVDDVRLLQSTLKCTL